MAGGCSAESSAKTGKAAVANTGKRRTLRIAQWNHLLPNYDLWFDSEYVKQWGEERNVDVVVDHFPYLQLLERADIEVRERRGHDIFGFPIGLPFRFEDAVIDHGEIIDEARKRAGPPVPFVERAVRNAKTGRFFAVPDYWVAQPAIYRTDVWAAAGATPTTWDIVRRTAPRL